MNPLGEMLHFGLSVPMSGETLPNLPELPECFELLELPGEALLLSEKKLTSWLKKQRFEEIGIRNLASADLTRDVNCESGVIVQEFKAQLRTFCARAHQIGAVTAGLDPDWETLFVETGRRDTFADVLRSIAGDLEYYGMEIDMAVRLPGGGAVSPERALELLTQLPPYRLKLALDVNPHELLNRPPEWRTVLAPFRFDVRTVRFAYESELGNQLLWPHVRAIVEALRSWKRDVNILLAPSGIPDVAALAALIGEAQKM